MLLGVGLAQVQMPPEFGCVCARLFLSHGEGGCVGLALAAPTEGGQHCLAEAEPVQHPSPQPQYSGMKNRKFHLPP